MVEIAQAYPQEIMTEMEAQVDAQVQYYISYENQTHKEASDRLCAQMQSDPSYRERIMADVAADFAAADANSDGILNHDEFIAFVGKRNDRKRAMGVMTDEREGVHEAMYELANKINPEREGISKEEFDQMTAVWGAQFRTKYEAAKAAALPYSAEIMASIEAMVDDQVAHFLSSEKDEHRAASEQVLAKMQADPTYKEQRMAEVDTDFATADSNNDGLLDLAEFTAFIALRYERKRAEGLWHDEREGITEQMYEIGNKINTEREGISKEEFDQWTKVCMGKWQPKYKAAKASALPYSAEIMAAMDTFINESVAHCVANMTDEHREAGERRLAAMRADPSVMATAMQTVTDDFNASDSNSDGILTRDEYIVFINKMNDRKKAEGDWTDEREGVTEAIYDQVINKINTEREGVSKDEWDKLMPIWFSRWMPRFEAAKSAAQQ